MGIGRADNADFEDTVSVDMDRYVRYQCDSCGQVWNFAELDESGDFWGTFFMCPGCGEGNAVDSIGEPLNLDDVVWRDATEDELAAFEDAGDSDMLVECPECGESSPIEQFYPVDSVEGGHRCPDCGAVV